MSWASSITSTVLVILPGPVSPRRFFFPAEDGIRALYVTGVQTCALPICSIIGVLVRPPARCSGPDPVAHVRVVEPGTERGACAGQQQQRRFYFLLLRRGG